MERIRAGLFLEDRRLSMRLARGLSGKAGNIDFIVADSERDLAGCDIVIVSEGRYGTVVLSEHEEGASSDGRTYYIYKYADSGSMAGAIAAACYKFTGKIAEYRGKAGFRLAVFLSLHGGSGTTSIAHTLSDVLDSRFRFRTLYISMCPVNCFSEADSASDIVNTSFARLLYHLKEDGDFPVSAYICHGEKSDYIDTGVFNFCGSSFDTEALEKLVEMAGRLGVYDYIFVDMGNSLDDFRLDFARRADFAVAVYDCRRGETGAADPFEWSNIIRVRNFYSGDSDSASDDYIYISHRRKGPEEAALFESEAEVIAERMTGGNDFKRGEDADNDGSNRKGQDDFSAE